MQLSGLHGLEHTMLEKRWQAAGMADGTEAGASSLEPEAQGGEG